MEALRGQKSMLSNGKSEPATAMSRLQTPYSACHRGQTAQTDKYGSVKASQDKQQQDKDRIILSVFRCLGKKERGANAGCNLQVPPAVVSKTSVVITGFYFLFFNFYFIIIEIYFGHRNDIMSKGYNTLM